MLWGIRFDYYSIMKLIEKYEVLIFDNKIRGYLLSTEHPIGKHKAQFFIKCGFYPNEWELLKEYIYSIAEENEITEITQTEYGTKFTIIGILIAPNGKSYPIKTIWITFPGTKNVNFVTAHPI